jgi:hypothetical protein
MTARHPKMFDMSRQRRADRPDAMDEHGGAWRTARRIVKPGGSSLPFNKIPARRFYDRHPGNVSHEGHKGTQRFIHKIQALLCVLGVRTSLLLALVLPSRTKPGDRHRNGAANIPERVHPFQFNRARPWLVAENSSRLVPKISVEKDRNNSDRPIVLSRQRHAPVKSETRPMKVLLRFSALVGLSVLTGCTSAGVSSNTGINDSNRISKAAADRQSDETQAMINTQNMIDTQNMVNEQSAAAAAAAAQAQ